MNVTSNLVSVTIYREGAVCARRAVLEPVAEKGSTQVRVVGLPLSLLPGSLRARVQGNDQPRVLDVRASFDVELRGEGELPVEARELEVAREALGKLRARAALLADDIAQLQALRPRFREPKQGDPPREAPVGAMLALADFSSGKLEELMAEEQRLNREVEDAAAAVELRERRLAEASTAQRSERAKVSRAAVVTLSAASATPLELWLEYQVPGVRWAPSYELRLSRDFTTGALKMRASVAQDTQEDWTGVELALSTASLERRTDLPELRSLRIGRTQPAPPPSGWREPPAGLEELFGAYDQAVEAGPVGATDGLLAVLEKAPRSEATRTSALRQAEKKKRRRGGAPPVPSAEPMGGMMPGAASGMVESVVSTRGDFAGQKVAARGAAPMPMAASVRAPAAPPPPAPMRRRAPAQQEQAPAEEAERAVYAADAGDELALAEGYADVAAGDDQTVAAGIRLDAAHLDYQHLWLSDSLAAGARGRLVPMRETELLFGVRVQVQVDVVMMMVSRAMTRAQKLSGLSLPAGCQRPAPVEAFDFRYDCVQKVDVPSTGRWVLVPVTECRVELWPEFVCVPSVEPKVFRTLLIKNAAGQALLPGPVDVSAGDEFLLTAQLPAVAPGSDAQRLGLGVEEAIKVSRKTQYKESTGGLLGGQAVLGHSVEIELNNRLSSAARIEVRERVPHAPPSEKDLKVEETEVNPPWEKLELQDGKPLEGLRRWKVSAPPGEKVVLSAQFNVRLPANQMLVGGNRRV